MADPSYEQLYAALQRADAAGDAPAARAIAQRLATLKPGAAAAPQAPVADTDPNYYGPVLSEGQERRLPPVLDPLGLTTPGKAEDIAAGFGQGVHNLAQGFAQNVAAPIADRFFPKQQTTTDLITGRKPSYADTMQKAVDESARLDAPLLESTPGKTGRALETLAEFATGGRIARGAGAALPAARGLKTIKNILSGVSGAAPGSTVLRTALKQIPGNAAAGATGFAANEAIRPTESGDSHAMNVAMAAGAGALMQGFAGPILQTGKLASDWLSSKIKGGKLNFTKVAQDLEKMGVTNVNKTTLAKVAQMVNAGKTDDVMQALRYVETQADNIPVRQAQISQDRASIARDQEIAQNRIADEPKIAIQDQWKASQDALEARRNDMLNSIVPDAEQSIGPNLGSQIAPHLRAQEATAKKKYQDLYAQVDSAGDASIMSGVFHARDKVSGSMSPLRQLKNAISFAGRESSALAPKTTEIVNGIRNYVRDPNGKLLLSEFEAARKRLGKIARGNDADAVAAQEAKAVLDRTLDKAIDVGAFNSAKLPNVVDVLRQGRDAFKQYRNDFAGDDIIAKIVGKKFKSGSPNAEALEMGQVSDKLFGKAKDNGGGFNFGSTFDHDTKLLGARLGKTSPQFQAIRADAVSRLTTDILKKPEQSMSRFLRMNEKRLRNVLTKDDLYALHRLIRNRRTVMSAMDKMPPSGEGIATAAKGLTSIILGVGGAMAGPQDGALGNASEFGAALWLGNVLSKRLKTRGYARDVARGSAGVPTRTMKGNPKVPASGPFAALLQVLRGGNGENDQ